MASVGEPDETQVLEARPGSGDGPALSGGPPADRPPMIGRYTLHEELGRGGMGVVYRAWDNGLQRAVALKTVRTEAALDATGQLRLLREARTASQLHDPGIVELYDCFEEGGQLFLTMRLVEGSPLSQVLRERGCLRPEEAARVALSLARALQHAHAAGITHRDIKPSNVLMEQGRPVLTDFGLARAARSTDPALTSDSQVIGTPAYMAPELIRQGAAAGPLTDQYALGVVLYEMLAGHPHVQGEAVHEILAAILFARQEPLPSDVPFQLAWICGRAMAPRPEDRFPDMAALATTLERYLAGQRVHGSREVLLRLGRRTVRRLRLSAWFVLLLALAFFGARLSSVWWRVHLAGARADRAEARRETMEARLETLRGAGRRDEASALFRSYAELPENQETAALGRAWLGEGHRRDADGDEDGAEQAFTEAYGLTSEPTVQVDALLALAADFRARDQWDRLRSVLAVLGLRGGAPEATLRPLRRDLAATEGDIAAATALNDDPDLAPLLSALSQVTPLEQRAALAFPLDDDGDGRPELGLYSYADSSLSVLEGGARLGLPREVLDLSPYLFNRLLPQGVPAFQGPGDLLLLDGGERCTLADVRGGELVVVTRMGCDMAQGGALADLDHDGRPELLLSDNRQLRVGELGDPARLAPIDATVNHANSEIRGIVVRDLDGDGTQEMALAMAGWGAYDLRVLRQVGARWWLVDRVQLGEFRELRTAREGGETLLAAMQYHDPSQPLDYRIFGRTLPHGAPRGVYLYAWDGDRLVPRGRLPWPSPPRRHRPAEFFAEPNSTENLLVGDLDGDGDDEIAVSIDGLWTWLYRRTAGGAWVSLALDGLQPLAFMNLDGDKDDELVLRQPETGKVYVVGAGDQALPRARRAPIHPVRPPDGLDPDMRAAWSRIEDLVALGMVDDAAKRLLTLADLGAGTRARGLALTRAAEILRGTRPSDAQALLEQAADEPDFAAPALEAAFDMNDRAMRTTAAIALGERRAALPSPPASLLARLKLLRTRAEAPTLDLVSGDTLNPAWIFDHPETPRAGPEGMRLNWAGEGVIGRVPVRWLGGPAGVEVTLRTLRQDWSAWLDVGIDPIGVAHPARSLSVPTTGGGDIYRRTVVCSDVPGFEPVGLRPEGVSRVSWTYDPVERKETCAIEDADGHEIGRSVYDSVAGDPPLEGWLVLWHWGDGAVSDLRLSEIRLTGFALREAQPVGAQRVDGRLARGDAAGALAAAGPSPSLARVIALDALDRGDEADATLRAAVRHMSQAERSRLLLLAPDRYGPTLRSALGAGWDDAFLQAFDLVTQVHPDQAPSQRALSTLLPGLERAPVSVTAAWLLTRRSEAWRLLGDPVRAEADAREAVGMALRLAPRDPAELRTSAQQQLALALLARDERGAAMAAILEALRSAPAPEVLADRLAHLPELGPLHGQADWSEVEAARTGRGE